MLTLADTLLERSSRLTERIDESNMLISSILDLNTRITSADAEIDAITDLINKNNVAINEFEKLHEKAFFLDSNIHLNDPFTNETSLFNLSNEFHYLTQMFSYHNGRMDFDSRPSTGYSTESYPELEKETEQPEQQELTEESVQPTRGLRSILSISNLNLKPLRCRNAKVAKQKSRYRLLSAYTLNPVQESRSISDSSRETHHLFAMSTISSQTDQSSVKSPLFKHMDPVEMTPLDHDLLLTSSGSFEEHNSFGDLENFHQFLRPSRVDLREAFPEQKRKFHNPVESIINKGNVSEPTVEPIFSNPEGNPKAGHSRSFIDHSRELLQQDGSPSKKAPSTPKKSNFTLFNLLNSPLGSPKLLLPLDIEKQPQRPRRASIDTIGKSLTSSFMNLVGKDAKEPKQELGSPTRKIKHTKPRKPRDPISIPNPLNSKRLPPMQPQSLVVGKSRLVPWSNSVH